MYNLLLATTLSYSQIKALLLLLALTIFFVSIYGFTYFRKDSKPPSKDAEATWFIIFFVIAWAWVCVAIGIEQG